MTRRVLRQLPGLLALSCYLVLAAGPTTPGDVATDLGQPSPGPVARTR